LQYRRIKKIFLFPNDKQFFSADRHLILAAPAKGISTTVDISALAPATYIVRVTTPSGTATKRLVKK